MFEKLGDGEGKLSVFFDDGVCEDLKVVFIEFVHRHLLRYARELRRERRYVCGCGEPVTDWPPCANGSRPAKTLSIA